MENSNKTAIMIGSLVIGAAIGGILGILLAPAKGKDTRKKIAGKTDEFTQAIKDKINALMDEAKKEFETEKAKAKEFVEQVTE